MKNNYSKGELAKEILFKCLNSARVAALLDAKSTRDRRRLRQSIQNLKKQKAVKIYKKNGEEVVGITQKGKRQALKYEFEDLEVPIPKKWDKLWRVVIFDIPEKHKQARDALNLKLKKIGFYPLQKSVFIFPYECRGEIGIIGKFFDVRKFINFFVIKEAENEKFLKRKFGL